MARFPRKSRLTGWLKAVLAAVAGGALGLAGLGQEAGPPPPVPAFHQGQPRPAVRLELESADPVATGQFLDGDERQEVRFDKPVKGRYFCLESLSAQDGRPYAAVAELDLLEPSGKVMDRDGWKIAYADSEEQEFEDGAAENAIDGNPLTFWHTQWGDVSPPHPHHLVVDLGQSRVIAGFRYLPRAGDARVGGRIRDYHIYVGDELLEANPAEKALPERFYLYAYFAGIGTNGLQLGYSLNGYHWDVLNQGSAVLKPELGDKLMRDPSLVQGNDGLFHMVWTASWTGNFIGYASSPDLIHWSEQTAIPVMTNEPAVLNCWAPEIFWDAGKQDYLVFWSSTVSNRFGGATIPNNHRIYYTATKDFKSFTETKLLFDPGFSVLDAMMLAESNRFYLVFKDDPLNRLRVAQADQPVGPFGQIGEAIEGEGAEGPMLFRLGGQIVVLYHANGENRCGAVRTSNMEHWEDITAGMVLPHGCGQGTVLDLPGERLKPFLEAGMFKIATPAASELGLGDWIWATNLADRQACRLWKSFEIPHNATVARALLQLTADNSYTVYLDGRQIGRGGDPNNLAEYDLTWLLSPGRHVLAVEAFNDTFDAGVILGLRVKLANGKKIALFSDSSWRVAPGADRNWLSEKAADSSWPRARVVGYAGRAWWQYPNRIIQVPPLQPLVVRFWQEPWVLALLLLACVTVGVLWMRQRVRLALQARANRLLERERARVARDMHDDLGSGLTQLTLLGELVLRETPPEDEAHARLVELCAKARALLRSMDEIVWVVNPRRDTVRDFGAFISEHAQEFLASAAIRCRQEVADELPAIPLELPQRRNLLLAVKEAIRNAARHSGASEVTLRLEVVDQVLKVVVEDNGRGFASAAQTDRNGLANMRQRLADVGGSLTLNTAPGQGCCITFLLPLTNSDTLPRTNK
jgi:signal transduction histidine kinase